MDRGCVCRKVGACVPAGTPAIDRVSNIALLSVLHAASIPLDAAEDPFVAAIAFRDAVDMDPFNLLGLLPATTTGTDPGASQLLAQDWHGKKWAMRDHHRHRHREEDGAPLVRAFVHFFGFSLAATSPFLEVHNAWLDRERGER